MVHCLFSKFVKTPQTEEEWVNECQVFMENYEFPCVGVLDGFHVHVSTHLKIISVLKTNIPSQAWG